MHRPIIYDEEQADPFDVLWAFKDVLSALGYLQQDVTGSTMTVASGLGASATAPASLILYIAAGRVYQQGSIDPIAYGALPVDTSIIQLQGISPAQTVQLSTAALSAGQSMWALIQAQITQADAVRTGDPTGGVLNYWNSASPSEPFQGPNNDGSSQPTVRKVGVSLSVVYGTPATTGGEVPPSPAAGFLPLYLVDLAFGQTTVANNQILVAGPSVGAGVPSNYPNAPLLAGLLNSHHGGTAGQAPKINLNGAAEVQGILPAANQSGVPSASLIGASTTFTNAQLGSNVIRTNTGVPMVDTLPGTSPGFLNNTGSLTITNGETLQMYAVKAGAGATLKGAASNGYIYLGPLQSIRILSDGAGNYWPVERPARAKLAGSIGFYVGPSGSNSANAGLTPSNPFATRETAYVVAQQSLDLAENGFTIQVADGTYTDTCSIFGPLVGQFSGGVTFRGNPGSPANVAINTTDNCWSLNFFNGAVSGFAHTSSAGACFSLSQRTRLGVSNVIVGACSTAHYLIDEISTLYNLGPYQITGGAQYHWLIGHGSYVSLNGVTVTLTGTPAFSQSFLYASALSNFLGAAAVFVGAATGVRYTITSNSVADIAGAGASFLPGNATGNATTGGQYF